MISRVPSFSRQRDARGGRGVRRRVRRCPSRREEDIARCRRLRSARASSRRSAWSSGASSGWRRMFSPRTTTWTRATATTATTRSWARRLGRASREGRPRPRRARRDRRRARSSPPREATGWTTSATCTRRCAGSEAPSSPSGVPRPSRAGDAATRMSSRRRRAARRRPRARPRSRTDSCSRRPGRARRPRRRAAGTARAPATARTPASAAVAFGRPRWTGSRGRTGASARSRRAREQSLRRENASLLLRSPLTRRRLRGGPARRRAARPLTRRNTSLEKPTGYVARASGASVRRSQRTRVRTVLGARRPNRPRRRGETTSREKIKKTRPRAADRTAAIRRDPALRWVRRKVDFPGEP